MAQPGDNTNPEVLSFADELARARAALSQAAGPGGAPSGGTESRVHTLQRGFEGGAAPKPLSGVHSHRGPGFDSAWMRRKKAAQAAAEAERRRRELGDDQAGMETQVAEQDTEADAAADAGRGTAQHRADEQLEGTGVDRCDSEGDLAYHGGGHDEEEVEEEGAPFPPLRRASGAQQRGRYDRPLPSMPGELRPAIQSPDYAAGRASLSDMRSPVGYRREEGHSPVSPGRHPAKPIQKRSYAQAAVQATRDMRDHSVTTDRARSLSPPPATARAGVDRGIATVPQPPAVDRVVSTMPRAPTVDHGVSTERPPAMVDEAVATERLRAVDRGVATDAGRPTTETGVLTDFPSSRSPQRPQPATLRASSEADDWSSAISPGPPPVPSVRRGAANAGYSRTELSAGAHESRVLAGSMRPRSLSPVPQRPWRSHAQSRLGPVREWLHEPIDGSGPTLPQWPQHGRGGTRATSQQPGEWQRELATSTEEAWTRESTRWQSTEAGGVSRAGILAPERKRQPSQQVRGTSEPDHASHAKAPPPVMQVQVSDRRRARSRLRSMEARVRRIHPSTESRYEEPHAPEERRSRPTWSAGAAGADRISWLMQLMGSYRELQLLYERYYQSHVQRLLSKNRVYRGLAAPHMWHTTIRDNFPFPALEAHGPSRESLLPAYGALSGYASGELETAIAELAGARALAAVGGMPAVPRARATSEHETLRAVRKEHDVKVALDTVTTRMREQEAELNALREQLDKHEGAPQPAPSHLHLHIHPGFDSVQIERSDATHGTTASQARRRGSASSTGGVPVGAGGDGMNPVALAKLGYQLAKDIETADTQFRASMHQLDDALRR